MNLNELQYERALTAPEFQPSRLFDADAQGRSCSLVAGRLRR